MNSTLAPIQVKLVRPVFLSTRWHALAMLNWEIERSTLEPLVPHGTELDDYGGKTFVSIVGFVYRDTRLLGLRIPFHVAFEEVNLRFYVRRFVNGEVRRAVCFAKEIVPRWAVSATARYCYNEQFVTLPMSHTITGPARDLIEPPVSGKPASGKRTPPGDSTSIDRQADQGQIEYRWRFANRWNSLSFRYEGRPEPLTPDSLEEFIAEHYWGYCRQQDGGTLEYHVEHPSWRTWPATEVEFDCDIARLYSPGFARVLCRSPDSAFLANGSAVSLMKPTRIA